MPLKGISVYLAGPVTGVTQHHARRWRLRCSHALIRLGATTINPMRNVPGGRSDDVISATYISTINSSQAIVAACYNDVMRCDAVLANISGQVSIGTLFEIAWAREMRKPVVAFYEQSRIASHPMIAESAITVELEDEAVEVIVGLLAKV